MQLIIRQDGKVLGMWVAKTRKGFNKKQKAEIRAVRLAQIKMEDAKKIG